MPGEEYVVFQKDEKLLHEDDDARGGHALTSLRGLKHDLGADGS